MSDPSPAPQPDTDEADGMAPSHADGFTLLLAVFVLAVCGLVYELIAGTLSSYLLGDSVTQFSLVIGLFLTAMGVGSFLSRYIHEPLLGWFISIELAIGVIGGFTAMVGFITFAYTNLYIPVLFGLVLAVGSLIGMEIPLIIRILRQQAALRVTLANVLSVDYLGALAASVVFPFLLIPHVGLVRAGLLTGVANVAVAGLLVWRLAPLLGRLKTPLALAVFAGLLSLGGSVIVSQRLVTHLEDRLYQDAVIYAESSPIQRIVLTRWKDDTRLYLNGHLQFSTIDEYRYHECLVHPAMSLAREPKRVLILGGGDGLAARQILKYPSVTHIDLVDLDPAITRLFTTNTELVELNEGALTDPRVTVHNTDAMGFLQQADGVYDVILADLPDPSEPALGKLYSRTFYGLVSRRLSPDGVFCTQATSPYRAREAFWCIAHTIASVASSEARPDQQALHVLPMQTMVPTFGTWGWVLAAHRPLDASAITLDVPTRYLAADVLPGLFVFPPDMAEVETPVSQLDDPAVVTLYRRGYHKYLQ